jgi:hypothetical protein
LAQISLQASTRSRRILKRFFGSVPWSRSSSRFQPAPTPNSIRPPESRSTEATAFAVVIGSRSTSRQIALPILIRSVAEAIVASATKGS